MSRTQHTRKPKVERVKEHPYNDVTAKWLRENPSALDKLRSQQACQNQEVRELHFQYAQAWLDYCKSAKAPEAVVKQAAANVKVAEGRLS